MRQSRLRSISNKETGKNITQQHISKEIRKKVKEKSHLIKNLLTNEKKSSSTETEMVHEKPEERADERAAGVKLTGHRSESLTTEMKSRLEAKLPRR